MMFSKYAAEVILSLRNPDDFWVSELEDSCRVLRDLWHQSYGLAKDDWDLSNKQSPICFERERIADSEECHYELSYYDPVRNCSPTFSTNLSEDVQAKAKKALRRLILFVDANQHARVENPQSVAASNGTDRTNGIGTENPAAEEFKKASNRFRQRVIHAIECYCMLRSNGDLEPVHTKMAYDLCRSFIEDIDKPLPSEFFARCAESHKRLQQIAGKPIGVELANFSIERSFNAALNRAISLLTGEISRTGFKSTSQSSHLGKQVQVALLPSKQPKVLDHAGMREELLNGDHAELFRIAFATDWNVRAQHERMNVAFDATTDDGFETLSAKQLAALRKKCGERNAELMIGNNLVERLAILSAEFSLLKLDKEKLNRINRTHNNRKNRR